VVLAVDTCGPRPRVALRIDGHVTTATPEQDARADDAASLAGRLLAAAGRSAADVTGIGVTTGPGSYTGVRIGLALVRGLSLVDRIPVVGTGTLELLAAAAPGTESRLCSLLDAGADKLYAAIFERTDERVREVVAPQVVSRTELARFVEAEADTAALLRSEDEREVNCGRSLVVVPGTRRIVALAEITARRLRQGDGTSADLVLPLYVGATGARPNRNKVVSTGFRDE
jgi:tRNA threonylcarbamoyladenosine biosynthesis protein TsaB